MKSHRKRLILKALLCLTQENYLFIIFDIEVEDHRIQQLSKNWGLTLPSNQLESKEGSSEYFLSLTGCASPISISLESFLVLGTSLEGRGLPLVDYAPKASKKVCLEPLFLSFVSDIESK
jgi:hypothetical protein